MSRYVSLINHLSSFGYTVTVHPRANDWVAYVWGSPEKQAHGRTDMEALENLQNLLLDPSDRA